MKIEFFSLVISFIFCANLCAQNAKIAKSADKKDFSETKQNQILEFKDTEIRGDEIMSKTNQMIQEILESKKVLDSGKLSLSAMWFKEYSNHPKIEEESNISREWFRKLSKEIEKLQYIAWRIECAKEEPEVEGHEIVIKKGPEKYKEILKTFKEIADKPEKISRTKKK